MTNSVQRIITGTVLAGVIILSVTYRLYTSMLLIFTINILTLSEFYRLFRPYTMFPGNVPGIVLSASMLTTQMLVMHGESDTRILLVNIPLAFFIFVIELYLKAEEPFRKLGLIFLGIICITIPLCFFTALAMLSSASGRYPEAVLGYFFILWSNDSGAYFGGKKFGKHPLFLRLSPKKTWEGSLSGAICTLLTVVILSRYFTAISSADWLAIALITIITGTIGDLIKSMMKRSLHIKDSGTILPGHGGMLDRFDSLLGSAPFVFCYCYLSGVV